MPQRITDTCHTEGQPIVSSRADDLRGFSTCWREYSGMVGKFNGVCMYSGSVVPFLDQIREAMFLKLSFLLIFKLWIWLNL